MILEKGLGVEEGTYKEPRAKTKISHILTLSFIFRFHSIIAGRIAHNQSVKMELTATVMDIAPTRAVPSQSA